MSGTKKLYGNISKVLDTFEIVFQPEISNYEKHLLCSSANFQCPQIQTEKFARRSTARRLPF